MTTKECSGCTEVVLPANAIISCSRCGSIDFCCELDGTSGTVFVLCRQCDQQVGALVQQYVCVEV